MRKIILLSLAVVLVYGCEDEATDPVVDTSIIMPLSIGNRWILQRTEYNQSGTETGSSKDTLEVVGDTLLQDERWSVVKVHLYGMTYDYGYINRDDGLYTRYMKPTPSTPALFLKYPTYTGEKFREDRNGITLGTGVSISTSIGLYTCVQYEFSNSERSIIEHEYYSKNIGPIRKETFGRTSTGQLYTQSKTEIIDFRQSN